MHENLAWLIAIIFAIAVIFLPRSFTRKFRRSAPVIPATTSDTARVSVRGWKKDEVEAMSIELWDLYDLPRASLPVINQEAGGKLLIRFPGGVAADKFLFLTNYLNYPRGFDLASRSIGIVGHVELAPEFGSPDSLSGKQADFYVPSNDTEYDILYARVDGHYYRISLSDLVWNQVGEGRFPAGARGL